MSAQKKEMDSPEAILAVEGLSKSFGGVKAQQDVSFSLAEGSVTGLIGPNGAGKTTLFNLITGAYLADSGDIRFLGKPIIGRKLHEVVSLGIARTFQNVELFGSMTALENVLVGRHVRTGAGLLGAIFRPPKAVAEERAAKAKAIELLSFVGLSEHAETPSGDLPFGWQRLLEIARALASDPKLILLDEPAAGLNAVETAALGELIGKIKGMGITVLLVEHDMELTMGISDRIVVLDRGRKIAEGTPREVQNDKAVMAAYLGNGA